MRQAIRSKILLCALLLSLISLTGYGQSTATVTGTVANSAGAPVGYATVQLKGTKYDVVCNDQGQFTLKAPIGNYTLQVSFVGHKMYQAALKLNETGNQPLKIELKEDDTKLNEVAVKGKNKTQELKESNFNVNAIDTKAFQNTTANLNQILDQTAGIRVRQSGGLGSNYNFSINGLSGNAVKYFIDGVPIEAMGGVVNLNNIPVNLAKSVEVYKGVVPIDFGADAMGGVVNVVTNGGMKNYLDASLSTGSFNTQQANVSTQYTNEKTGFIIKANGYVNYSKNNYIMKAVELYDNVLKQYTLQDRRRFHDEYISALGMVEAGYSHKKWADLLLIGASYSKQDNDLQTGTTQNILYGSAERQASSYNLSLKYKKDNLFIKNLNANIFASYSANKFKILDTAFRQYFWDGTYNVTNRAEISGAARSIRHYTRPTNTVRANFNYKINDAHALSLNYQLNDFSNEVYDQLTTVAATKDMITKQILGFAYQQSFFDSRLSNTFFTKWYGINLSTNLNTQNSYYSTYNAGNIANANGTQSNWGYGLASRFKITENTGIKASYEYTYRLQEPDELLGNGYTVMPNFDLKPESSNNYNLGFYAGNNDAVHRVYVEGSGFIRQAQNYIQPFFREALGITQYQNTGRVTIKGIEGEVRYNYGQLLNVDLNASYQNAVNKTITNGTKEITYDFKLPNRPWFFGNAFASIGKNDLIGKDTRLQLGYSFQYIHWFYLTWADFADPAHKDYIPNQSIHNLLLSYSFQNSRYNLSLECRNLTDALAYDNFKLQKPGRAYFLKFRVYLTK